MARTILVLGATGHLGRHLVPMLVDRYGQVSCFVRSTGDRALIDGAGVNFVEGDLRDPASVEAALRGVDTLVSAVVLHRFARPLLDAWKKAGIRRSVFVTTTSIFTSLEAETKRLKIAAESELTASGLNCTVLRPTMIYGTPADRNIARLVRFLRRWPVVPIPGDGESLGQPVHVEDVAAAIVDCLDSDASVGKAYNLSGARAITFNQMIDQTCEAIGVRRLKVHLPLGPSRWAARMLRPFGASRFVNEEQLLRLNEDKSFDHSAARRDFGFSPRTFEAGVRQEVALCLNAPGGIYRRVGRAKRVPPESA